MEVVSRLLAVQAQDLRAALLALRARSPGFVADDVGPGLVRTWLLRGTLHLVAADDWAWLHALTAPRALTANTRRLAQLGVAVEAADAVVARLGEEGPMTRAELGVSPHVVARAALEGRVVMDRERFVRVDPPPAVDRDRALAELGRRYLRAHAPADARDLAAWAGLPLRDARRALATARAPRRPDGPVGARLLPMFDPYLLGWRDRSFAVAPALAKRVHPGGGIIRATATIDGLAVGTWSAKGLDVPDPSRFADELADVARFSGART